MPSSSQTPDITAAPQLNTAHASPASSPKFERKNTVPVDDVDLDRLLHIWARDWVKQHHHTVKPLKRISRFIVSNTLGRTQRYQYLRVPTNFAWMNYTGNASALQETAFYKAHMHRENSWPYQLSIEPVGEVAFTPDDATVMEAEPLPWITQHDAMRTRSGEQNINCSTHEIAKEKTLQEKHTEYHETTYTKTLKVARDVEVRFQIPVPLGKTVATIGAKYHREVTQQQVTKDFGTKEYSSASKVTVTCPPLHVTTLDMCTEQMPCVGTIQQAVCLSGHIMVRCRHKIRLQAGERAKASSAALYHRTWAIPIIDAFQALMQHPEHYGADDNEKAFLKATMAQFSFTKDSNDRVTDVHFMLCGSLKVNKQREYTQVRSHPLALEHLALDTDALQAGIQAYYQKHYGRCRRFGDSEDQASVAIADLFVNLNIVHHSVMSEWGKTLRDEGQKEQEELAQAERNARLLSFEKLHALGGPEDSITPEGLFALTDKEKKTNAKPSEVNRILVLGRPGYGKTTLCYKLLTTMHEMLRAWKRTEKFQWVWYVSLRELRNELKYPSSSDAQPNVVTLAHILQKEYERVFGALQWSEEKVYALCELLARRQDETLWIVDGWDEIAAESEAPHLNAVLKALLAMPHLIVTTRPYSRPSGHFDRQLAIVGFNDTQVEDYIKKFYDTDPEPMARAYTFIQKLKSNTNSWAIMHVPVQAEMACILERDGFLHLNECVQTLSGTYDELAYGLMKRYFSRPQTHAQVDAALIKKVEPLTTIKHFLTDEYCGSLLKALSHIAYHGLTDKKLQLVFSEEALQFYLGDHTLLHVLQSLLDLGFIHRSSGEGMHARYRFYSFSHLTWQEYFAALRFVALFTSMDPTEKSDAETFIQKNKYQPALRIFWQFVVGQLRDSEAGLTRFFELLEAAPRDLIGCVHFTVLVQSIEASMPEGEGQATFEQKEVLLQQIKEKFLSYKKQGKNNHDFFKHQRTLLEESLKYAPRVCEQSGIVSILLEQFKDGADSEKKEVIEKISRLNYTKQTVRQVADALVSTLYAPDVGSDIKVEVVNALGSIPWPAESQLEPIKDALVKILLAPNDGWGIKRVVAKVLGKIQWSVSQLGLIADALVHTLHESDIKCAVASVLYILGKIQWPESRLELMVDALLHTLLAPDVKSDVKSCVISALGRIPCPASRLVPIADALLPTLLAPYEKDYVKYSVVGALHKISWPASQLELIADALVDTLLAPDTEMYVKDSVVYALGRIPWQESRLESMADTLMHTLFASDVEQAVKKYVVYALGKIPWQESRLAGIVDALVKILLAPDEELGFKKYVVNALSGRTQWPASQLELVADALVHTLLAPDMELDMRVCVVIALGKISWSASQLERVADTLVHTLFASDVEQVIKKYVANALDKIPWPVSRIELFADALVPTLLAPDGEQAVKNFVIDALGKIPWSYSRLESMADTLVDTLFASDVEQLVKKYVADALVKIPWPVSRLELIADALVQTLFALDVGWDVKDTLFRVLRQFSYSDNQLEDIIHNACHQHKFYSYESGPCIVELKVYFGKATIHYFNTLSKRDLIPSLSFTDIEERVINFSAPWQQYTKKSDLLRILLHRGDGLYIEDNTLHHIGTSESIIPLTQEECVEVKDSINTILDEYQYLSAMWNREENPIYPVMAPVLVDLGISSDDLADAKNKKGELERNLVLGENIFGENTAVTAHYLYQLAQLFVKENKIGKAVLLFEKSFGIYAQAREYRLALSQMLRDTSRTDNEAIQVLAIRYTAQVLCDDVITAFDKKDLAALRKTLECVQTKTLLQTIKLAHHSHYFLASDQVRHYISNLFIKVTKYIKMAPVLVESFRLHPEIRALKSVLWRTRSVSVTADKVLLGHIGMFSYDIEPILVSASKCAQEMDAECSDGHLGGVARRRWSY